MCWLSPFQFLRCVAVCIHAYQSLTQVLENYHAGIGLQLLNRPGNDFLTQVFPPPAKGANTQLNSFRRCIVNLVLATDLAHHGDVMKEFRRHTAHSLPAATTTSPISRSSSSRSSNSSSSSSSNGRSSSSSNSSSKGTSVTAMMKGPPMPHAGLTGTADGELSPLKLSILKMAIKAADISHPTREFAVHEKFSKAIQVGFVKLLFLEYATRAVCCAVVLSLYDNIGKYVVLVWYLRVDFVAVHYTCYSKNFLSKATWNGRGACPFRFYAIGTPSHYLVRVTAVAPDVDCAKPLTSFLPKL